MARHSTGASNNKVAGSFIVTVLAILVVIALIIWWVMSAKADDSQAQGPECIEGDLTVKVAAASQELADPAIAAFNNTDSVVRDHCVTAEFTKDISEAAVYITAASDGTANAYLANANRSAATLDWPVIDSRNVGAAAKGEVDSFDAAKGAIRYASKGNSLATALVAAGQNPEDQQALQKVLRESRGDTVEDAVAEGAQAIAVSELDVPDGYSFIPLQYEGTNVTLPIRAVALNPNDKVSEDQTRAGAEFGAVAAADSENPLSTLTGIAAVEALANVEGTNQSATTETEETAPPENTTATKAPAEETASPASGGPTTTLYLLDTSDFMGQLQGNQSWFTASANAIAEAAPKVGATSNVGLWNYSSPLNPGVAQGWRTNVDLDDTTGGRTAAEVVMRFGTAGQPQTLSAVSAALKHAAKISSPEKPVRIVLVSSGTADSWDLTPALENAKPKGVKLDVVQVGGQDLNPAVADAVKELGGTTQIVNNVDQIEVAINKASGL